MNVHESELSSEDNDVFQTLVEGLSMQMLSAFCESTYLESSDYFEKGKHYIPSPQLVALFKYATRKILKENTSFKVKTMSGIGMAQSHGTNGNRVFLNEDLVYKIKVLCRTEKRDGWLIRAEISKAEDKNIVLSGIYSFLD